MPTITLTDMENQIVLGIIGVLYIAVEGLKVAVMKKNGKVIAAVKDNVSELKLEEERHHTKIEKLNEIRGGQHDIRSEFVNMAVTNAKAHQALTDGILALSIIMKSVDKQLEKIEKNTRKLDDISNS